MSEHNQFDYQKFLALDESKQERIINAAMKAFIAGYKNASTNDIVREAGISKGMLFHYFGTKELLYSFIIDYAIATVQREYLDLINVRQPDILDSIWQTSLLKKDLSERFPDIFDFLTNAYVDEKTGGGGDIDALTRFVKAHSAVTAEIYAHADTTLFRDDVDKQTAMQIIGWTMSGYAHSKVMDAGDNPGMDTRENYDQYLEEFKRVLDILRLCLYK